MPSIRHGCEHLAQAEPSLRRDSLLAVVRGLRTPGMGTLILVGSRLRRRFLWQACCRHQCIQKHPDPAFGAGIVDDAALAVHADKEPINDPCQQRAGRSRCSRMPRPGCCLDGTLRRAYRRNLLADTDNPRRNPEFGMRRGPLQQVFKGSAHAEQIDGTRAGNGQGFVTVRHVLGGLQETVKWSSIPR